jgi:hypothetical protein
MTAHHVRGLQCAGTDLSDSPCRYDLMGHSPADAWPLAPLPPIESALVGT